MRLPSVQPLLAIQGAKTSANDFRVAHWLLYLFLGVGPWLTFLSYKFDSFTRVGDVQVSVMGGAKDLLVATFGAVVVAVHIKRRSRPRLAWNLWALALVGFIAIAVISAAVHRSAFSLYLARTYLLPFIFLLLVAATPITARVVRNACWVVIANGLAFSAIAVAEYAFSVDVFLIGDPWELQLYNRVSSIFEGPNTFANQLVFPLAASVAFLVARRVRYTVRALVLSITLVLLVAMFLTASRSGIIATALIVALWTLSRLRFSQVAALMLVIVAIPISLLVFAGGYSWNLFYGIPEAAELRLNIWEQILKRGDSEVILSTGKDVSAADPLHDWDSQGVRWGPNILPDGSFEESRSLKGVWEPVAGTPVIDRDTADFVGRGQWGYRAYSTRSQADVVLRARRFIAVDTRKPHLVAGSFRRWWHPPAQSAIRVVCYDALQQELGTVHPNRPVEQAKYAGRQFRPGPRFARYGGAVVGRSGIDGTARGGFMRDTAYIRLEVALNSGSSSGVVADALVLRPGTIPGKEPIVTTSNSYLRLLVDYGVAGIVLYMMLLVGLLAVLKEKTDLSLLALSVLAAYLAIGFLHDVFVAHPQMLFVAFFAGLALNPCLRREQRALHPTQAGAARSAVPSGQSPTTHMPKRHKPGLG